MNKTEFIAAVAEKENISKQCAGDAVNAVLDTILETLGKGETLQILGFGTFAIREKAERQGINPLTRESITIPAAKVPIFRAGKAMKDAVAK